MHLSWATYIDGVWSGENCHVQIWEEVLQRLSICELIPGTVELSFIDEPEFGPMSIGLTSENEKYLVTLLEATEDGSDVRIFTNPIATTEMIDIWEALGMPLNYGGLRFGSNDV
jgi:hypothetical protein